MTAVTVNPAFATATHGAIPEFTMNFGMVRRVFGTDGQALDDGRIVDAAKIINSANYTSAQFVGVVQALLLDNLRILCEGNGGVEFPEDVYSVEYMIGALDQEGVISNYVTVEVIDPISHDEFRQDIELSTQYELERGVVHGNDTEGLTRLFEVYFKTPSLPFTDLKLG